MSKTQIRLKEAAEQVLQTEDAPCLRQASCRPRVALLSNPTSTGNVAQLSRIRAHCADHPDIFHYEVDHVGQIGDALRSIARVQPRMLVINGGDGTVQATLTEIHNGNHFPDGPPPMAVIPSGKTNLIALDLGIQGDPIVALERLVRLAREDDLGSHLVARELIALRKDGSERPVIGMFLGGAGLADTMIYCRDKIYPLGLPNAVSHGLTAVALMFRMISGIRASFLPPKASPLHVSTSSNQSLTGRFTLLIVTTLEKLLLSSEIVGHGRGSLKLVAVEEKPFSVIRALIASLTGGYKGRKMRGIHFEEVDEITIEGESSNVILDGETFRTGPGSPIHLQPTPPLSFVRLAA